MSLITWNIRGLNDSNKIQVVKKLLGKKHVSFVGLLETRVRSSNVNKVTKKLEGKWRWIENYDYSPKGMI